MRAKPIEGSDSVVCRGTIGESAPQATMACTESLHARAVLTSYVFILIKLCFITVSLGDVHPVLFPDGRIPKSIITIAIYDDGSSSIYYHPPNVSHLPLAAPKSVASTTEAAIESELIELKKAAPRSTAPRLVFTSSEATSTSASGSGTDDTTSPTGEVVPRSTSISTSAISQSSTSSKSAKKYLKLGASSHQEPQSSNNQLVPPSIGDTIGRADFNTKDIAGHHAWSKLSATECGESFSDRIIGGIDAKLGQYPWLARIGYDEEDGSEGVEFRCGGVLVAPRNVLTAAHCVQGLHVAKVRLGEHDIQSDVDCDDSLCTEPVQDFVPVRSYVHELFNQPRYSNDVAMLELDRDANYNGWVAPICLPRGSTLTSTFAGTYAHAAGWGVLDMNTQATARTLQTVRLPVLEIARCVHTYRRKATISDEQMCAGAQPDKDACSGDSGGPLMKVLSEDGTPRYFLLGVVSFGPRICGTKQPGVYANVSHHMPWILDHIKLDYN